MYGLPPLPLVAGSLSTNSVFGRHPNEQIVLAERVEGETRLRPPMPRSKLTREAVQPIRELPV